MIENLETLYDDLFKDCEVPLESKEKLFFLYIKNRCIFSNIKDLTNMMKSQKKLAENKKELLFSVLILGKLIDGFFKSINENNDKITKLEKEIKDEQTRMVKI